MTCLTVYPENAPDIASFRSEEFAEIQTELGKQGVLFRRWPAQAQLPADAASADILEAYADEIAELVNEAGYLSWDVVSMHPEHPDKTAFREKFLQEHTHAEDEVRFFVRGQGLFSLHLNENVYELLCEKDDLISVPAGTPHWFDMGANPEFTAIRLFNNPDGWIANFTGDPIADRFSRLQN